MLINITHNAYTCTIICYSTNIRRFCSSPTHLNTSPSVPHLVPIVVRALHSICNTEHAVLNATASTRFLLSVDRSLFSVFNWWVILFCALSFFKNRSSTMKTFNPTCDHGEQVWTIPAPDDKHMLRWYFQLCFQCSITTWRTIGIDSRAHGLT